MGSGVGKRGGGGVNSESPFLNAKQVASSGPDWKNTSSQGHLFPMASFSFLFLIPCYPRPLSKKPPNTRVGLEKLLPTEENYPFPGHCRCLQKPGNFFLRQGKGAEGCQGPGQAWDRWGRGQLSQQHGTAEATNKAGARNLPTCNQPETRRSLLALGTWGSHPAGRQAQGAWQEPCQDRMAWQEMPGVGAWRESCWGQDTWQEMLGLGAWQE